MIAIVLTSSDKVIQSFHSCSLLLQALFGIFCLLLGAWLQLSLLYLVFQIIKLRNRSTEPVEHK